MPIILFGINHKTAEIEVRSQFAVPEHAYADRINQLLAFEDIQGAVILSTCNRTEYYLSVSEKAHHSALQQRLFGDADLSEVLYRKKQRACAGHLFAVTAGIDSMVVGETQIQSQVKRAHDVAREQGALDKKLDKMFQMAFKAAKAVRSSTAIGKNPVSVAHCAVQLSKRVFGDLSQQKILIIGAGETAELIIRYLLNHEASSVAIANRTRLRAERLGRHFNLEVIALEHLPQWLHEFDLLFTATASPQPLVSLALARDAIKRRKHKPMVMVDLAVPRDIDAKIQDLDDVFLYTVDDLQKTIVENINKRQSALSDAERIIDAEVQLFLQWLKRLQYNDLIRQFMQRSAAVREEILQQHKIDDQHSLQPLIDVITEQLVNKLMHPQITGLRQVIEQGDVKEIEWVSRLLQLNNDDQN